MKNILSNNDVKSLSKKMGLDLPKHYLEVDDYECDNGKVIINSVRVLDATGKLVKLADMNKVFDYLHRMPVHFKIGTRK